jgi:DNA adenine methylase
MRYFGGKAKIAKQISSYINNLSCNISEVNKESPNISQNLLTHTHTHTHSVYVEPFCGSCNVATKVNISNKILNDKHPYLIAMWKELQDGWIPPDNISEELYYKIKAKQDQYPYLAGFVGFACSFAGKYWGGYARDNKDVDKVELYALRGHNSVLKKLETLKDAEFTNKDFSELSFKNSLIYCDPPYKGTTPYYKSLLGDFSYDKFLRWVKEQSKENLVLVSEYKHNVPKTAAIVLEIKSKTSIRDKTNNVIETIEVLWTYNKELIKENQLCGLNH